MTDAIPDWAQDQPPAAPAASAVPDWAQDTTAPPANAKPAMFLTRDASGRMIAAPSTEYNQPDRQQPFGSRTAAGATGIYEEPLGFSKENLEKYPLLQKAQPAAQVLDALSRIPGAALSAASGAVGDIYQGLGGSNAWADRLVGDINAAAQSAAPEIPMEGAAVRPRLAMREAERMPPLPPADFVPPAREAPSVTPRQTPRPQAGIDLLPPETPHTLPPERRGLSAMGASGPLSDISDDTINYMRKVMDEQGFNANTLDQRLGELSEHHFFGEITPSLEADMGAVAAPPGPGKLEVMNSLRQRAVEARERVQNVFNRAFGVNENLAQLRRIMEIDRAQASAPFYQQFRNTVITPTPEIDALMPRLQSSGALQAANRSLALEGEPATNGFMEAGDPPTITRVPTASAFQYAKEALDDRIGTAVRAGERNEARRLVGLQKDLLSALDNHPQVGDVWRQARSTYAQPTEILKALDFGKQVLTGKVDADELPFLTSGYSDPQMRAMRIGMRSYLENLLGKRDALTAETINTALSPNNVQKMRWAIGDQQTDELVNSMEAERHMHTAPTRIHGGSLTALRLEAQKRWTVQPPGPGITLQDVAGAAERPIRTALRKGVEAAAERIGASRLAQKEAKMAKMREEASRIFTLQGPERDAVARFLVGGQDIGLPPPALPTRAQGGRINFNRARHAYTIKKQGGGELSPDDQAAMMPETFVNPAVKGLISGAAQQVAAPGQLAAPNPYAPGSEEAAWYEGQRQNLGEQWARQTALSTMGTGAIAGVPVRAGETALGAGAVRPMRTYASPEYNPAELHPAAISTRLPTGAKATEDPIAQSLTVDTPAMKATPGDLYDTNVNLVRDYPGMKKGLMTGSTDRAAKQFQDQVTNNLLWLHDQVPPDIRERSKLWYDGANRIVKSTAQQYGIPDQSAAGVYAALSPQKDWFQNVSLGQRLIDTYFNKADAPWTPQMTATAKRIWDKPQYAGMLADIQGKSLRDLAGDPDLKAMWIRTYDQAHNSPAHPIVTPEGGFGDTVTTKSGTPARIAWGSLGEIGKGVQSIESGGDAATLSQLMGERHKVRSFYNNMLDPMSQRGDVTIDTHAVAAGLLRPLSGNSLEVAHNFQNYPGKGMPAASGSAISGIQGTYPLYADAYRQAAAERGILPREMQSITWEAARGLFPDTFKTARNMSAIDNIWKQYGRGRLDLNEARSRINDLAGGIRAPDWYQR